jgi:hypothetical protein
MARALSQGQMITVDLSIKKHIIFNALTRIFLLAYTQAYPVPR